VGVKEEIEHRDISKLAEWLGYPDDGLCERCPCRLGYCSSSSPCLTNRSSTSVIGDHAAFSGKPSGQPPSWQAQSNRRLLRIRIVIRPADPERGCGFVAPDDGLGDVDCRV